MTRAALALAMTLAIPTFALPLHAQTLTGEVARAALFAPVAAEVEIMPEAGLPEDQAQVLVTVGEGQLYYGAIAIAPDEGLMSEATVAATNFHDSASAATAALAECNAKKKSATDCVVAAHIRPKGWAEPAFSLSSDATAAFETYDPKTGALAISVLTGAFGYGDGAEAGATALAKCAAMNEKATDCALVVEK